MKLIKTLLLSVMFVAMWSLTGCNEEPTTSVSPDTTPGFAKLTLPAGAVIQSATLNIFVEDQQPVPQTISVHKVNVPWDENTETYTSFIGKTAPQFDPASIGSFTAEYGWESVDITALVIAWANGTTPNSGVLLYQAAVADGLIGFRSKEYNGGGVSDPFLEVTYTAGGVTTTISEPAFGDTWIWNGAPNTNYGSNQYLNVARPVASYEKYTIVKFDIEQPTTQTACGTGYAYGDNLANCFIGLPGVQANNWGWTNFISASASASYDWPIYVGAGQCNLSNGTLVGYLHVNYNHVTDVLTLNYTLNPGYTNSSLKIWIGSTYLPFKRGKYTTAPGQFNHKEPTVPYTVTGLSNNFYIAAHFDICWQE